MEQMNTKSIVTRLNLVRSDEQKYELCNDVA